MKRMVDIHDQGIDIVFRDNNRLDEFEWSSEEATLEDTLRQSIQAFSVLTQLWLPEYWMVELSPFVFESPDTETESFQISSDWSTGNFDKAAENILHRLEQHTDSDNPWSLKLIQTSHKGWNRLVLPPGVSASDSWGIVDPDSILRNSYVWHPAPQFTGYKTIWIKIQDANAATHCSLNVDMTGEIRILTSFGISFFNPKNDARSPAHVIQGATVNAWQQVNLALIKAIIEELEQLGWNHSF